MVVDRIAGSSRWRAIEFFAGIGGFACAWPECEVATAIDIDPLAREVYQLNWKHPYLIKEIKSLGRESLVALQANLWWLSPHCQPYSRRGRQRDVDDPRSRALLHLIRLLEEMRPAAVALENVVQFADSQACAYLDRALDRLGYHVASRTICPTDLGWPNRRPRFYLLAAREPLSDWRPLPCYSRTLEELLQPLKRLSTDAALAHECQVSERQCSLYGSAMDRVDIANPSAVTACFGSSYGKSLLHAGSYLVAKDRWRRFTPREVARLLGYPLAFAMPEKVSCRRAWKLLGNSLSIPVVRYVLAHLPGGPPSERIASA